MKAQEEGIPRGLPGYPAPASLRYPLSGPGTCYHAGVANSDPAPLLVSVNCCSVPVGGCVYEEVAVGDIHVFLMEENTETYNIWISRFASFPGHSLEWRRLRLLAQKLEPILLARTGRRRRPGAGLFAFLFIVPYKHKEGVFFASGIYIPDIRATLFVGSESFL